MSENVLILGATSDIAQAVARVMATRKARLVLAGRKTQEIEKIAQDLAIRTQTEVFAETFDALAYDDHLALYDRAKSRLGELHGVVLCYGYMAEQTAAQDDFDTAKRTIDVNLTSAISILEIAAKDLATQGRGYIAGISSVAGDRGRQSNYIYGASKAGLTAYLEGLRNRLFHHQVHVLTIKPGFVYTALTEHMLDPKSPMVASPDKVGKDIDRAIRKRKSTLYTPWFWWGIMTIIRSIPDLIFKRLKM